MLDLKMTRLHGCPIEQSSKRSRLCVAGSWRVLTDNINLIAMNLTLVHCQGRDIWRHDKENWSRRQGDEGSERGKLSGQVVMAVNLSLQVRTIAVATTAGDLTQKITGVSIFGEIVNTINDMIDQLAIFAAEVKKIAREAGTEGKPGVQAEVCGFAQVSAAAMDGGFTRFITVEAFGDSMDSLKMQINQMVFNLWDSIQKNTAARRVSL
ncbi:hypothetical protein M378DRAFT_16295 [Amanita muscaria Koide BX008]|uniref:HAMP domain-containing protein n=1 Tax=Amanita muscaria (strain Koide BX008) TaxID=946122 RepID=A0A0C2S3X6_AMAMK|nr:hypothetical protein M378DRAFT_16295 [Amanita muscaria Koide BX008]